MKNIKKIVLFSKPLYKYLGLIAFFILITSILQQVSPVLTKQVIEQIELNITGNGGSFEIITKLMILIFAVNFIGTILSSISNRLGDHYSGELRRFLTNRFYEKVLTLPQSFFDSQISGKIANQLSRGILTIKNFSGSATNFFLPTFMQSFLTIGLLAYYNWPTAVFITLLFPIYFFLTKFSTDRWGKYEVEKNRLEDVNGGRITEVLGNIKLVKSFTNEEQELVSVDQNLSKINNIYAKQSKTFHIIDFLRNTSLDIILIIVNVIIVYLTFNGNMSFAEMVLILQLVTQVRRPLFAMSFILSQFQLAESGSKEFFDIMDIKEYESTISDKNAINFELPSLEFKNIVFGYNEEEIVLNSINLDFKSGNKTAIVGHSGAGKSTIINLILGFYKPSSGSILINGVNYDDYTVKDIRNNIALVLQDNELFSSTIRENITYGNPNASEEEIIDALKKSNAYDFVMKLEKKLDTEIGERGLKLSGGQKQRIQIARAILKDAPILILDEATSNLDSQSEILVHEALENLMKNKLVIIIAHRFSTIQNVDKIVVIDKKQVADVGTPQELSRKDGIYSKLLKYQIEGNKKLLKEFELY